MTPKSPGCASVSGGTRCTIGGISLAVGSYAADVTAFSRTKERGAVLSHVHGVPFTLKSSGSHRIAFTMEGVPASFAVIPVSGAVSGSAPKGFTIGAGGVWGDAQTFLISTLDAGGNAIVGPGSPGITVSSSNDAFEIVQPSPSQRTFSVTPPASVVSASSQLTLNASFPDKSVCSQRGARCVQNVNLVYAPFAADDWITFAHDFQRTGLQTQPTGISVSSVQNLTQRWRINVMDNVYGSPVVYNGNVIVVTYNGFVYDLSAVDGSVIWKTTISSATDEHVRSTPMVDAADGLVFIGTWYATQNSETHPQPSQFYALRLSDGSVLWKTLLPGMIHDPPVYINGVVYEGWSGGDLACITGGVTALSAKTGAVQAGWPWLSNPLHPTGGGGGIWGALAWDGSHLIFGTGNTCTDDDNAAQGAVALNLNGTSAWSFQADATESDDSDTGSGVTIHDKTATFFNKNGSLYTLDTATGARLVATALGGSDGHATPTSDGSIFVVGAGFFPTTTQPRQADRERLKRPGDLKPGYISYVKGVSANGTVLWSVPMTFAVDSYAAITNGVVFVSADAAIDAISLQSGAVLDQFPGASNFNAGPVVVPSGLYVADNNGFVYAYSLPQSGSAIVRRN